MHAGRSRTLSRRLSRRLSALGVAWADAHDRRSPGALRPRAASRGQSIALREGEAEETPPVIGGKRATPGHGFLWAASRGCNTGFSESALYAYQGHGGCLESGW